MRNCIGVIAHARSERGVDRLIMVVGVLFRFTGLSKDMKRRKRFLCAYGYTFVIAGGEE